MPARLVRLISTTFAVVAAIVSCSVADDHRSLTPEASDHYQQAVRPLLVRLCGDCHSPEEPQHTIRFLQSQTAEELNHFRGQWHSVAEQLRNRTMPPADQPQPTEDERLSLALWIDQTLRAMACDDGEFAGVVVPRRLNRFEYERTILELVGVPFHASESFPVDGSSGEGFNNNGEALYMPPLLMERYLAAATEILDTAIIPSPYSILIRADELQPAVESVDQNCRIIATKEEPAAMITIYVTGDYDLTLDLTGHASEPVDLRLLVDGLAIETIKVPPPASESPTSRHQSRIHLTRGVHTLSLRNAGQQPIHFNSARVALPERKLSKEQTEIHQRLLGLAPGQQPDDPDGTAQRQLEQFASRAFRRPVSRDEVDRLLVLYHRGAKRGDPWEESVKLALRAILVSPRFLFRIEAVPESSEKEPVPPHELASRLSYFLWSGPPDEELMQLAASGQLLDDAVLTHQVDRMLDDPRAMAFSEQFVGQWLGTHEVGARVAPSTDTFLKQFTSSLLHDMHDEPIHFFEHLVREDQSLLKLLDSDYVIINDRLAEHYGYNEAPQKTPGPNARWSTDPKAGAGGPFREFQLPDDRRGGVLGMGGVHLLTSYPNRTSPVLRGGWVLETLLGVHVPPPPPDVPQLKHDKKARKTLRDQLAQHRENPTCAACHNLMDPLGFALENFDVLSRWRDEDQGAPIDASATLPSGEVFTGPGELRKVLLERKEDFLRQITRKMLGYAVGRSLEDADDCTVQQLMAEVEGADYRTRALVHAIVSSTPFRFKQITSDGTSSTSRSRKPGFSDAQIRDRDKRDRR